MTDTIAAAEDIEQARTRLADLMEALADLIEGSGFTAEQLGFLYITPAGIREEVAEYRKTGVLP